MPQTPEDGAIAIPLAEPTTADRPGTTEVADSPLGSPTLRERFIRKATNPWAPLVVMSVFLVGWLGYIAVPRLHLTQLSIGTPRIVTFDPVKFTNAQRKIASVLQVAPNADLSLTMTQVAKHAEAVILEEAHGALVLVRQTVVAPVGIVDITDAVLQRFGLPTDVPSITIKTAEGLENLAPTDSAFSEGKLREDYRVELDQRDARKADQAQERATQESVLP